MSYTIKIIWAALFLSAVFFPKYSSGQETVRLVFAEDVENSKEHKKATVAKGHVEFNHGDIRLFCDSAIFFQQKNLVHAYSNVQINQGDTVNLYCDSLKYNGNTNISKLLSNVRFRDNEFLMTTDSLEYDANQSLGYYTNHAVITSIKSAMRLTSVKGYYYSNSKIFFFKDSVHLKDEKYELFSDTLEYRTQSATAHFHGPTEILMDSATVWCNKGVYYSKMDSVQLWNGATLNEPGRMLYADSLLYSQQSDIGEGYCNVFLYDSTENIAFKADFLRKYPKNQAALLKDNARMIQYGEKDTLYLGGDTIRFNQDTLTNDKTTIIENNVWVINGPISIRSDSAYFSERDSILKLHKDPIVWNEKSQLFADSIFTTYYDNEFHEMLMYHNAMIISEHEDDSVHFDQVKGKFMTAQLDSGKIDKVRIELNSQTLYFPTEKVKDDSTNVEKEVLSGMNKIDCNEIEIRFEKGDIQSIAFLDQPTSIFYPMDKIPDNKLYLKDFRWEIERKPVRPLTE